MKLHRFETPAISHFAYLLADGGEAVLVDPRRDIEEYLSVARKLGVRIAYVLETHRHEDFVMGSAHLSERIGAQIINGTHACFGHGDKHLRDGESFKLGELTIQALATPGHTPESMSYAVYAPESRELAWAVFSGDALFFGDTGRTDLPDVERTRENAELLYDMVHGKIAGLGDSALLLPAHGPGSVCGSGMADRPYSTIGAEKLYNKVFTSSRTEFAALKANERLPRPPYFKWIEKLNLAGGIAPVVHPDEVALVGVDEFAARAESAILIDTRDPEAYAGGHIADSYAVWAGGLPVFGGWIANPDTPIYLLTANNAEVGEAVTHLTRIGLDNIKGALAGGFDSWRTSGQSIECSGVITPRVLADIRDELTLLDVREKAEFASGHVRGARNVYVGTLEEKLPSLDLPRNAPLAVTCAAGHRAGLAVSILRRAGYDNVRNLSGGMTAWKKLDFEVVVS